MNHTPAADGPHLVRRARQPDTAGDHGFGILNGFAGAPVRDDYDGYLSYNTRLAGVRQCLAHQYQYQYLNDAFAIDRKSQAWTRQVGDASPEAVVPVTPPAVPALGPDSRSLSTLQRHCSIRSYLTTVRSYGPHPLAAIDDGT